MAAELTPMMKQYMNIKEKNKDTMLFYRLGDFYEMFGDDARIASRELDLALTSRDRSKGNDEDKIPMCGVPYHAVETYIAKLISKGYKVAMCDQLEDPATAKGLVDRDIVRIITPGTVIESSMLDESKPNYLCSVFMSKYVCAAAFCDLSTGEFRVSLIEDGDMDRLYSELSTFAPAEAILNEQAGNEEQLKMFLKLRLNCMIEISHSRFDLNESTDEVRAQFKDGSADVLDPVKTPAAICAVGALLSYLKETQKTDLSYINKLAFDNEGEVMEMDFTTLRNLELVESTGRHENKGTLLWVLNKAKTPMGRRLLRAWILHPLLSETRINRRLAAVSELFEDTVARSELILTLSGVGDMERLISRIVYGTANARDLKSLEISVSRLPRIRELIMPMKSELLRRIYGMDALEDIWQRVSDTIVDEPPFSVREGGLIKPGVNSELDRLRTLMNDSSGALSEIERKERERTGKKLKIGYNRVFGYYIEIPRSMSSDVPDDYVRKQTLANNERFITAELKELEDTLLNAKDRITALEFEIFNDLRLYIAAQVGRVQLTATDVAELDVLCAFGETASKNHYCRPVVNTSDKIVIESGRHPVVELMQDGGMFVPNSTDIDCGERQVSIITGPNMAGKSTFMRQTALIVLMAQIGSFVPAEKAEIGIVDRVFTRIGASDDLAGGRSTFMVEMTEVSAILKNATAKSLVLLDEIGRGTSTYDGMAVARAVVEFFLNDRKKHGAKVLFATHYHELSSMEREKKGCKNYHITAKKQGDDLIFLRRIEAGCADDSYGIEVAALAGVPKNVTDRAKDILSAFHTDEPEKRMAMAQMSIFDQSAAAEPENTVETTVLDAIRTAEFASMTPLQVMELLYNLQRMLKDDGKE